MSGARPFARFDGGAATGLNEYDEYDRPPPAASWAVASSEINLGGSGALRAPETPQYTYELDA